MVIEIINNQFVEKVADDKWEIKDSGLLLDWQWNKETKQYANTEKEVVGNKPPEWQKMAGLYFQKWKQTNSNFMQDIYRLIRKRNDVVHNGKSILDKEIIELFDTVNKIISFL